MGAACKSDPLPHPSALSDLPAGRTCLGHVAGAGLGCVFRAQGDDDVDLGSDDVQTLAVVFADLVHDAAATLADQADEVR